jgi:pyrroloquinoline-quinone synthase
MTAICPHAADTFLKELEARIASKNVLRHPFYQAWNQGTLPREALQDYAAQYYRHVEAFPAYLSAVHSHTPDAQTRRVLLQNLIEEEAGSPNHPDLWLQFAEGMGVSRETVHATPARPETAALVETFRNLCRNRPYTEGIAALYAYESQIPEVAQSKIDGLKARYHIEDEDTLRYFAVHVEADEVHRAEERALLARHITTEAEAAAALASADAALDALWNLLSDICHRHRIVCD